MLSTLLAVLQKVFGNSRYLWREKTRYARSFIFVPVHVIMFQGRLSAPVLMSFVSDSEQCSFAAKKKKEEDFFFFFFFQHCAHILIVIYPSPPPPPPQKKKEY